MPTLFILFGLRFFFYSNDHEPIHVHVRSADGEAKFKIEPLELVENKGLKTREINLAESLIDENIEVIKERWNEYFKS